MKLLSRLPFAVSLLLVLSAPNLPAGLASWYGETHRGRLMANGRPFDPDQLTAASWFHPLGTRVRVAHGGRTVEVIITDRGPAQRLVREGRVIDLSRAAFAALADPDVGLIEVTVSAVPGENPPQPSTP